MAPILIVVTGLPASGKTTTARFLADTLGLALFSKDAYKELLFETLGAKDRAWSKQIGRSAIELLYQNAESVLKTGHGAVIESNFRSEFDNERLTALIETHKIQSAQIVCVANGDILLKRFSERATQRHAGHSDTEALEEFRPILLKGEADPLTIPGLRIDIDTTDWATVDLRAVATRIQNTLG